MKNNKKKLTRDNFIKRSKEVHGEKYDYSLVDYKNNLSGNACPICKERQYLSDNKIKYIKEKKN